MGAKCCREPDEFNSEIIKIFWMIKLKNIKPCDIIKLLNINNIGEEEIKSDESNKKQAETKEKDEERKILYINKSLKNKLINELLLPETKLNINSLNIYRQFWDNILNLFSKDSINQDSILILYKFLMSLLILSNSCYDDYLQNGIYMLNELFPNASEKCRFEEIMYYYISLISRQSINSIVKIYNLDDDERVRLEKTFTDININEFILKNISYFSYKGNVSFTKLSNKERNLKLITYNKHLLNDDVEIRSLIILIYKRYCKYNGEDY